MTIFEHAMLGVNSALAVGLQKRFDWQIVALAGVVAVMPDWDGLIILLSSHYFAIGHRVWGHNLLVAGLLAMVVTIMFYRFDVLRRSQHWLQTHWAAFAESNLKTDGWQSKRGRLIAWLIVGLAAAYSHLLADMVFSTGKNLPVWGVPLLWPFSDTAFYYPMVPWGDVGPTIICATSMFIMLRWPKYLSGIASCSLGLVVCYMIVRRAIS